MASKKEILEGLADAGCTAEEICEFGRCLEKNDLKTGLRLLERCRKEHLRNLHEEQRKIDTLNYLAYQIRLG